MTVDRRGDYGFDTPSVPIGFAAAAAISLGIAVAFFSWSVLCPAGVGLAVSIILALSALSFIWTTRRGKFIVWAELLDALALRDDEHHLDVGCGRGAVLVLAAASDRGDFSRAEAWRDGAHRRSVAYARIPAVFRCGARRRGRAQTSRLAFFGTAVPRRRRAW